MLPLICHLKFLGQLDSHGLQIYALCLWQLGKNDMALSMTRSVASSILSMEENSAAASVSFICRLLYHVSGQESAITSILKMPKELFRGSKISFIVSAIHALDQKNQLEPIVSSSRSFITSREDIIAMHILVTLHKLVSSQFLWFATDVLFTSLIARVTHAFHFDLFSWSTETMTPLEFRRE